MFNMKRTSRARLFILVLPLVVLLCWQIQQHKTMNFMNESANPVSLHMDQYNICRKGKPLIEQDFMLKELPHFIKVYEQRPGENKFGTRFAHQFAMWCALRKLQPLHVIESGIYRGLGTWLLRQAAPNAQLILIDPKDNKHLKYEDHGIDTVYFTGKRFKDFKDIDWSSMHLDLSRTLVFFDDHQAGLLRTKQAYDCGFKIIMFDDNCSIQHLYDNLSLKIACAVKLKYLSARDVEYRDSFGKTRRPLTETDVQLMDDVFDNAILQYMEFPLPWSSDDVHNNTLIKNNNEQQKYRMENPNIYFQDPTKEFNHVCLVKLQ